MKFAIVQDCIGDDTTLVDLVESIGEAIMIARTIAREVVESGTADGVEGLLMSEEMWPGEPRHRSPGETIPDDFRYVITVKSGREDVTRWTVHPFVPREC